MKPDASNMAYATTKELPMHTDFPSLSSSPQLQMLHMIESAIEGGENLFVDGFNVANIIRNKYPSEYRLLTTVPVEYIEEGYDHISYDCMARHPIIRLATSSATKHPIDYIGDWVCVICRLDSRGVPDQIEYGNAMRSWFYDIPIELIQPMYRAMKLFVDQCYLPENLLSLKLNNGHFI